MIENKPIGEWLRPSEIQAKRGIVAILRVPVTYRASNGGIGQYFEEWRYTVLQMNRRIARGGHIPKWIVPNEKEGE